MKHTTTTIILGLAMILSRAAYSQTPNPPDPGPNAGIQQALNAANISDIFTASRNGEAVTINVKINFAPCRYVRVVRNPTGVGAKRTMAGRLEPGVTSYVDILPDAKPHWYWLQVVPIKGNEVNFGPIRVEPDTAGTGNYVDAATIYKWTLTRSFQKTAISWNFQSEGLKFVEILRKTNIDNYNKRTLVFRTLEKAGETTDTLPDPEADYWYWISATLTNGRVVTQGPFKAEYSEN